MTYREIKEALTGKRVRQRAEVDDGYHKSVIEFRVGAVQMTTDDEVILHKGLDTLHPAILLGLEEAEQLIREGSAATWFQVDEPHYCQIHTQIIRTEDLGKPAAE